MCLTFQIMTLEKHLTVDFEEKKLGGTPVLIPQNVASPKMTTPALSMTPLFIAESFSTIITTTTTNNNNHNDNLFGL